MSEEVHVVVKLGIILWLLCQTALDLRFIGAKEIGLVTHHRREKCLIIVRLLQVSPAFHRSSFRRVKVALDSIGVGTEGACG